MKQVYTTKTAEISYYEITDYLLENWGHAEYEKFESQVLKVIQAIEHNPKMDLIADKHKNIRKAIILSVLSMYYRILEDRIEVLLFWHNSRRNYKSLGPNLACCNNTPGCGVSK